MTVSPLVRPRAAVMALTAFLCGGCAEMFPEKVSMGVARLTVHNAAVLVSMIKEDARCGFSSPEVQKGVQIESTGEGYGTATYTVRQCTLDFGPSREIRKDCQGVKMYAGGKVTVSATLVTEGL